MNNTFNKVVTVLCTMGVSIHLYEMINGVWQQTPLNYTLLILSAMGLISGLVGLYGKKRWQN